MPKSSLSKFGPPIQVWRRPRYSRALANMIIWDNNGCFLHLYRVPQNHWEKSMHCPLLPYSPHWPPCPIAKCEGEKPAASLQLGGKSRPNIFYGVVTIPASTIKKRWEMSTPISSSVYIPAEKPSPSLDYQTVSRSAPQTSCLFCRNSRKGHKSGTIVGCSVKVQDCLWFHNSCTKPLGN